MELIPPYIPDDIKSASQFRDVQTRNNTLPFDVLGLIFHHIPKLGPFDLHQILFVCHSWHEAVCHHSSLWSDIKLDYTLYTRFSVGDTFQEYRASDYLRCCLKYSGIMPLDITLDFKQFTEVSFVGTIKFETHTGNIETRIIPLLKVLVGQDEEHLARWRSFTWGASISTGSIPITLSFLPSTIPNLQTATFLDVFYLDNHQSAFPVCPNLQTVQLHLCNQFILKENDCSHVTELKLGTDHIWHSEDVMTLHKFSNVRRLTIYTVGYTYFTKSSDDSTRAGVPFPHLHSLRLYGGPAVELVKLLKAPKLKELEFDKVSSFDILEDVSLASTIETAHIQIRQCDIDSEVSISEKVMGLLTVVPLLKRLCVPKWLHEELESGGLCLEERRVHLEVVPG